MLYRCLQAEVLFKYYITIHFIISKENVSSYLGHLNQYTLFYNQQTNDITCNLACMKRLMKCVVFIASLWIIFKVISQDKGALTE